MNLHVNIGKCFVADQALDSVVLLLQDILLLQAVLPHLLLPHQLCDGQDDCKSGEDEWGCSRALCPQSCTCVGASATCELDVDVNMQDYKALYMVSSGLKLVTVINGCNIIKLNL